MAGNDPSESPPKAGITFTRDFEIVEMSSLSSADKDHGAPFTTTTAYSVSTAPRPAKYASQRAAGQRWVDSFKRASGTPEIGKDGYFVTEGMSAMPERDIDRFYDLPAANARTANSALVRELKGRHLQMIAIGGSIGTPHISILFFKVTKLIGHLRHRTVCRVWRRSCAERPSFCASCIRSHRRNAILHNAESC
jgi:amino acid transporter